MVLVFTTDIKNIFAVDTTHDFCGSEIIVEKLSDQFLGLIVMSH
jgi:hypothetical protein